MGDVDELAAETYAAYGEATGWLNHRGEQMPQWWELPADIRAAWRAAVQHLVARIAADELP